MTLAAEWHVDEPQLRVAEGDARTALGAVLGRPVISARARLRFGPGRTCEAVARLLDRAIVQAEDAGLDPGLLVVADGRAQRERTSSGCAVRATAPRTGSTARPVTYGSSCGRRPARDREPGPAPAAGASHCPAERRTEPASEQAAAVLAALSDVIDPDLGVNIVDLGFVRAVAVEEQTAVITMTLTSAACPLTNVMESQIRTELARVRDVEDFRVDWQWIPAWRPADITDGGREQLRAIGFTI